MRRADRANQPSARLLQALWIALYTLGLLLSTAHYSLVSHSVCEHGEVAHGEVAHGDIEHVADLAHCDVEAGAPVELAQEEALPAPAVGAAQGDEPSEEDGHEHCELDPATQAAPAFELSPLSFAQWLEECFGPVVASAPRAPAIAVLRLAPGHSPPRG